ncbi:MAG: hypothetical protein WBA01_19605 [Phormidesmis sp.]
MKVLLAGITLVAAAVGAGIGYASLKTGDLPSAGSAQDASAYRSAEVRSADSRDVETRSIEPNDVVISENELNQRVNDAIASDPTIAPIINISKGVETSIEGDRVESGLTINLNDLPLNELPVEAEAAVSELLQTFPFLSERDVYIGVEGRPQIVDGAVSLDDTNIRFGPLKLPVSSVASQLGVSQTDIEQQLNAVLEQEGLTPESIEIVDGQIVIKGL